jgi:hypothetical protein
MDIDLLSLKTPNDPFRKDFFKNLVRYSVLGCVHSLLFGFGSSNLTIIGFLMYLTGGVPLNEDQAIERQSYASFDENL